MTPRRRRIAGCLLAVSVGWVLVEPGALAWGPVGHRMVAQIADAELTPAARARVTHLLQGESMAEASNWADRVRDLAEWEWTAPLHYANVRPGAAGFEACPPEGCVVDAVRDARRLLAADATRAQQAEALRFLIHFVGDVHQPLHVARAEDRGGNGIEVRFFGQDTNLHRVWDSLLIEQMPETPDSTVRHLLLGVTAEERHAWLAGDVVDWADESYRLSLDRVYRVHPGSSLGASYVEANLALVERRLLQAGVRLGDVLNSLFATAADPAPKP